jgi:hypothetical protein
MFPMKVESSKRDRELSETKSRNISKDIHRCELCIVRWALDKPEENSVQSI